MIRILGTAALLGTLGLFASRIVGFDPRSFPSVNTEDIKFTDCSLGGCNP